MSRASSRVTHLLLGIALGCSVNVVIHAQEAPAGARAPGALGMDERTREALIGQALKGPKAEALPSQTPEQLATQVSEVRIFLTDSPNTVIGEIAIEGRSRLTAVPVPLEKETVRFLDDGKAPDRKKGDGVFTARFTMDTRAAFRSQQQLLRTSAQALDNPGQNVFVRRGPRDIVPAKDAAASLRGTTAAATPDLLRARGTTLIEAKDPRAAAKQLGIDIRKTPFLEFPVERIDPRTIVRPPRLFEIPMFPPFPFPPAPVPIDKFRSLMVIDPGVVDEPARTFDSCTGTGTAGGVWSFGHLVREMAKGTNLSPEDFVLQWLSTWSIPQEANGFIVNEPGRGTQMQARVVGSWQRIATAANAPLNVDHFPARLLAIVNRPDLADKIGYGTAGSAGEGRFVFGLVEKNAGTGTCITMPFTVIFEYGIKGGSCSAVKAWHQRWKNLDALTLGSSAYNDALALITKEFTEHGVNPGQLPNQNALNQLRTNENALDPTWQLREFRLQGFAGSVPPGFLDLVTVKQSPDDGFNNSAALAAYLQSAQSDILGGRHAVPERFPGMLNPFLGARSNVPFPPNAVFWNADLSGLPDPAETRRNFSLSTCNACHGGETNTFFTHIGNVGQRSIGSPAALSGFLTGITVNVPVTGGQHIYNDLAERELKMSNILNKSCFALLAERRIPFEH
jgi:hypothetical protein